LNRRTSLRERAAYWLGFDPRPSGSSAIGVLPGWGLVAIASGLMAAALPPIGLAPLAFFAPATFLLLCLPTRSSINLRMVFWWGLLQWMVTFHFIRLPHWAGWIGWPVLAGYFAFYNVLLVAVSRRLIGRANWPPVLVIPLVWVSLELLRCTLFTGFPMGLLGHSLYRFPFWIQTADIAGELTVSFLIALVGCSVAVVFLSRAKGWQNAWLATLTLLASLGSLIGYGFARYNNFEIAATDEPSVRVALVQGARDVQFGLSAEESQQQEIASFRTHQSLTMRARAAQADLVVWAESMFPMTDILPYDTLKYQALWEQEESSSEVSQGSRPSPGQLEEIQRELPFQVRETTGTGPQGVYPYQTSVPMVVGMRSFEPVQDADYNAAIFFDPNAQVAGRYFKTHLVPFGEYLPLGDVFPWFYQFAPMRRGLTPGSGVTVFEVKDLRLIPSICYESVVGRVIRRYLTDDSGKETISPGRSQCDALLNISNDGWFWGSSALDLHLASNVFRAVENRTPHLVVCNTGISAEIAANGRIVQEAPKREAALIVVEVHPRPPAWSPWWWGIGNTPWWIAVAIVGVGIWLGSFRSDRSV
jgi:apolipoprotein N-acyltransferase